MRDSLFSRRDDIARQETVPRALWLAALLFGVTMMGQCLLYGYMASGFAPDAGTIGIARSDVCSQDRFCKVLAVLPDSPADRAGVRAGQEILAERYWERYRMPQPDETVRVTLRGSDGALGPLVLRTAARPLEMRPTYITAAAGNLAVCLIALLLLARSGRKRWVWLLGLALICYVVPGAYPRQWQNDPAVFVPIFIGLALIMNLAPALMLFALRGFRREIIGDVPRWLDRLAWGSLIVCLCGCAWAMLVTLESRPYWGVGDGLVFQSQLWSITSLLPPLALAAGWRRVPTQSRTRYSFMWLAVAIFAIDPIIDPVIMMTGNNYVAASWPVLIQLSAIIAGAALFAYAVLRHRVVDLGFAINRTLVFSTISFLLLLTFGLLEWAGEKLLPEESHEASLLIDGMIALGVFLLFHRVHEWVEKNVERLFFHHWHAKARDLKAFLRQAAYITSPDVLLDRAAQALSRYAGQADLALYRHSADGYRLQAGHHRELPILIDPDTEALVVLRAERETLCDAFAPGDLVLPMLHRADVIGFVILAARSNSEPYRTDEQNELAIAVRQIGLDLYALRVEELEGENRRFAALLEAHAPSTPAFTATVNA